MRLSAFIEPAKMSLEQEIQTIIDHKTKPLGALGQLENLAKQICLIQQTTRPELTFPRVVVFAADHGITEAGVSAYPKEVTAQMVLNFVQQGAAINVFTRQHGIELHVVDAGVDVDFDAALPIINKKVAKGTASFLASEAMTDAQMKHCLNAGREIVDDYHASGGNVIGFGEMGIGNTSSAALIMHYILGHPVAQCIGRGTGLDEAALSRKGEILELVRAHHGQLNSPEAILQTVGGFEIAMMCGAMLRAAELRKVVLIDGFIASSAALLAREMVPESRAFFVFCHQSEERGHRLMLEAMEAQPLLDLGMRLGEGSACALAYPLLQSAVAFMNEMASFESAQVSNKTS